MHLLKQKVAEVCAKRARRKEERPGELLAAALDLFVEKGFAATRAEEVAARAGVSKGTLFLYYKSKEDLFKAVVRESIGGRYREWSAELASFEGTTAELLSHGLRSWWTKVGETKASGITKLMMCEAQNFPELAAFYESEVIEPGRELTRRILQRGMDRGEFRAIDIDYGIYTVFAPMIFLTLSKHATGACVSRGATIDPERYIATHIDTLLRGICTPSKESL
jgi:AcrR family transcriptional regulator